MGEQGHRTARRTQAVQHCPVCGSPVGMTVKRHKTLGTFVPRWVPGPCSNPDCAGTAASAAPEPPARRGGPAHGSKAWSPRHRRPPAS